MYEPPFTITPEILSLAADISEKVGRIGNYGALSNKPRLRKQNRIKSIYSSLKIEANSLSLSEVTDVINGESVYGDQKEIREVQNAYAAYKELERLNPYSVEDLLSIHRLMTEGILSDAGSFRQGEEGVFDGNRCIFIAPPADRVPELIRDLFDWMQAQGNRMHPLILSAVFHYEFVFIHPFSDGNGRMARLWHTLILTKWKPLFAFIPLESKIETFQQEYYRTIARCHGAGNSTAFIEFSLDKLSQTLDDVLAQMNSLELDTTEPVRDMLSLMEETIPYTAGTLMAMLGLRSKETFRKNYMDPAIAQKYVEMTVPDKPTSRNQRYRKKI